MWAVVGMLAAAGVAGPAGQEPQFAAAAAHARGFILQPGLELGVWAAEPQLQNGVAFSFDHAGRCYIAETHRYGISVFDITPLTDEAAASLGLLGNYYSAENMIAFLDGIEEAMGQAGLRLPVVLKPKRTLVAAKSDPRYLKRLDGDASIRQLAPATSVYGVVAKSAAVIVYPFTTVAYVAEHLGVPAIYFDPTGRREALYEHGRHIRYASGTAQLAAALRAAAGAHA